MRRRTGEDIKLRLLRIICVLLLLALPVHGGAAPALDRPAPDRPDLDNLVIIVPASAGGGFDKTAQSVATAMRAEGIVRNVEIRRSPGAGGLIALAQFEGQADVSEPTILIGGVTILGAEAENHSLVSLTDLEPVCQLSEVALTIGVRADSPIRSVGDLVEVMRTDPDRLTWVGGSPGSADEVLLWSIAAKLGVAHDHFKFVAVPGGGERVLDRLADGPQFVAIRSYEEFASYPGRSKLRLLAISTADRFPRIALPTLRESGFDLVVTDWKGAFISPRTPQDQRQAIGQAFERLLASPAWARELAAQGWRSPSDPQLGFKARIAADRLRIKTLLPGPGPSSRWDSGLHDLLVRPWRYALLGFFIAALLGLAVAWQRRSAKIKDRELERALDALGEIRAQVQAAGDTGNKVHAGERGEIARQMVAWGLSAAEVEIGWMILKGLQFKEIAAARGTSERTVRQQAQSIYAKSELPNRSEFSAHFLEDLRF
ncbi:tripartite tricarboxylate transporter substrate-binding protein [Novosphingobium sp.]|uniref:tripartite tricarboxylate transporter substrate-binding protein n=1 Tax=Novosphingobium sp. TaxID=1874826 RepID=UPI0025EE338A|nr:tripartite tricarboxylate transporter substrate-binding protein [Novosphingobium sp.]